MTPRRPLPSWPAFADPAEEARFRAAHDQELAAWVGGYAPLLVVVVVISAVLEVLLFPRAVWLPALVLLLGFVALPVLASWQVARQPDGAARVYGAVLATAISAALAVAVLVSWPRSQGHPQPYEGILLVMMAVFVLSGLRARDASLVSVICVAGVVLVEWCWPQSV